MLLSGLLTGKAVLLSAAFCLLATGCASSDSFGGSKQRVLDWSKDHGFSARTIRAGVFDLLLLEKRSGHSDRLNIYIEGDGAAWITAYHPPREPTPLKPTALVLAALDPAEEAIVYLGRPCQYLDEPALANCSPVWWTTHRFAPEILSAYDQVLNELKSQTGAQTLKLVGYSGGGVVAALLALRRQDVSVLITVASPLAVGDWTRLKGISPLSGSLDPLYINGKLPPAIHWIGTDDRTVPLFVVEKFALNKGGHVRQVSGYDHDCCWTSNWPQLLKESP